MLVLGMCLRGAKREAAQPCRPLLKVASMICVEILLTDMNVIGSRCDWLFADRLRTDETSCKLEGVVSDLRLVISLGSPASLCASLCLGEAGTVMISELKRGDFQKC